MDMKLIKRLRIRRKLRQLFRQVLNNRYWLLDASDTQLGEDVKANVAHLIYRKTKKDSGGLSIHDKSIMRKRIALRTEEEKLKLYNSIGGMKCFRLWPENVKFQMVACTHFVYYEPGRTIVKEGRLAEALYFLVTGEIEMTQTCYDEVIHEWSTVSRGRLLPGKMFGQGSLLQNYPLQYSFKTLTHCELLKVEKGHFNETLRDTLKELWDEIKEGLKNFPYFTGLSENTMTECCTLAKLKEYAPDEIIYSYQAKKSGMAYFILEGNCRIIEKMYIRERKVGAHTTYSIYIPSKDLRLVRSLQLPAISSRRSSKSLVAFNLKSKSRTAVSIRSYKDTRQQTIKNEILKHCPQVMGFLQTFGYQKEMSEEELFETESQNSRNLPGDVKCHFIEICTLSKSACFFENETFDNRYLVSNTKMKILTIPVYWLFQNNRADIWNRLIQFMNFKIPSTEKVFKQFVDDKKWLSFKRTRTKQALGKKSDFTTTLWSDVPYSLRISDVYKQID